MELLEFLKWLAFSGGAVIAFSWVAEHFEAWHALESKMKQLYSYLGSVVIALTAWAIMFYVPAEMLQSLYEPFAVISGLFMSVFINERFHSATK